MRIVFVVLFVVALCAFAPAVARADGPLPDQQPWMFPAAEYTGLGTVQAVQAAFKNFQDWQAFIHQYTTAQMWRENYGTDVTNFLRMHGCASCLIDDNTLSIKLKIDVPVALRDFSRFDLMDK